MFADLTTQTMFGCKKGVKVTEEERSSAVWLPEASEKLAATKPDEQEEIQPKAPRS